MTHVAVLVPGIMGSELRLGGELIWPGPVRSLVFAYKKMEELMSEELVATDVIRSVSFSDQYGSLIEDLNACGFSEEATPPTLYVCPYDWRKDNGASAAVLSGTLERVVDDHGEAAEVSIVAHSMGGLVGRYYLESGDFKDERGLRCVRRLLTLGTPHRGAPLALTAALGFEKRLFLSSSQVRQLVSDVRYPALYQLLPPQDEPFAWDEGEGSAYAHLDVYDEKIARSLGLVSQNLQAAKNFHSRLDISRRPAHVRYFFFVGTRQKTTSSVKLKFGGDRPRVRKNELEDAGDGTVPLWSGSMTGMQAELVGGEHGTIFRNAVLRKTMAVLLGKDGVLAPTPGPAEVAIRERVVNPNSVVHLSLSFASALNQIDGELRVRRAMVGDDGALKGFHGAGSVHPVHYSGLNAERLGVTLTAPRVPGIYQVSYYPDGYSAPAGKDELFVQEAVT